MKEEIEKWWKRLQANRYWQPQPLERWCLGIHGGLNTPLQPRQPGNQLGLSHRWAGTTETTLKICPSIVRAPLTWVNLGAYWHINSSGIASRASTAFFPDYPMSGIFSMEKAGLNVFSTLREILEACKDVSWTFEHAMMRHIFDVYRDRKSIGSVVMHDFHNQIQPKHIIMAYRQNVGLQLVT